MDKKKTKLDVSKPLTDEDKAEWKKFMEENKDKFTEGDKQESLTSKELLQRAKDTLEILKHWDDDSNKHIN